MRRTRSGDAAVAAAVWLAATALMTVHFGLGAASRPPAAVFAWVALHTGSWLVLGLLVLEIVARLAGQARAHVLLGHATAASTCLVLQPLLQYGGMRLLAELFQVSPVFGPVGPWPEAVVVLAWAKAPATLATYAGLAAAAHLVTLRRGAAEAALHSARLEAAAREAELKALRAQLDPHFLFNALHSIGALVEEDPAAARTTLARLSDLLRLTLDRAASREAFLREELRWVEAYLDLERVRFEERLAVEVDVPADALDSRVPPLILQPLVENAVKHGVGACETGARIVIRARRTAGELRLEVETHLRDAPGPARAGESHGLGLNLTRSRLDLLYARRASLEVTGDARQYTVALRLPAEGRPT